LPIRSTFTIFTQFSSAPGSNVTAGGQIQGQQGGQGDGSSGGFSVQEGGEETIGITGSDIEMQEGGDENVTLV